MLADDRRVHVSVGPWLRWTRAAVLTAVATATGLAAHLSAGGLLPGVAGVGVLVATLLVATSRWVGRPASTMRVVALLVTGQTFVHGALTAMAGHRDDLRPATPHGELPTVPHEHLGMPVAVQHLLADLTGAHAPMALAHLAAAAVMGLWLAVGERALWALVSLLGEGAAAMARTGRVLTSSVVGRTAVAGLGRLAGLLATSIEALTASAVRLRVRPLRLVLLRCVVRRGPPALLAA